MHDATHTWQLLLHHWQISVSISITVFCRQTCFSFLVSHFSFFGLSVSFSFRFCLVWSLSCFPQPRSRPRWLPRHFPRPPPFWSFSWFHHLSDLSFQEGKAIENRTYRKHKKNREGKLWLRTIFIILCFCLYSLPWISKNADQEEKEAKFNGPTVGNSLAKWRNMMERF